MKHVVVVALVSVAVALAGCAPPGTTTQNDQAADREALEPTTAAWQEAFNTGDAAAIAAMYADDAIVFPPDASPLTGRAEIERFWQDFIDTGISVELHAEELEVSGDLAYRIGAYTVFGADGGEMDNGHYMEIWRRRDGKWVFERDMWNSDVPEEGVSEEGESSQE